MKTEKQKLAARKAETIARVYREEIDSDTVFSPKQKSIVNQVVTLLEELKNDLEA